MSLMVAKILLLFLLTSSMALRMELRSKQESQHAKFASGSPPGNCAPGRWAPVDEGTAAALAAEVETEHEKYPDVCVKTFPCKADKFAEKYESDCLKPFSAQAFAQAIKGKTVSFIGDSLISHFFHDLSCKLMAVPGLVAETSGHAGAKAKKWGEPEPCTTTLTNGAKLQTQRIGMPVDETRWARQLNESGFMDADIIVANLGAIYQKWDWLKKPLGILDAMAQERIRPEGRLLFMEYSPTHFHSATRFEGRSDSDSTSGPSVVGARQDGDYGDCGEVALTRQGQVQASATQFRLEEANRLMEDKGWEILRTHDLAASQWNMHKGNNDCRHWCTNSPVHDAHRRVFAQALGA